MGPTSLKGAGTTNSFKLTAQCPIKTLETANELKIDPANILIELGIKANGSPGNISSTQGVSEVTTVRRPE